MISNQKGFTLTQILITLGITGGLSLMILRIQENALLTRNKSNHEQTINEANLIIQSALKDKATCSFSLRGKLIGDDITSLVKAQTNPHNFDDYVSKGQVLAAVNKPLPGEILITRMSLVTTNNTDYLAVDFNLDPQNRKTMVGAKTIKKLFPIKTIKSGGSIFSCYSETDDILSLSENEVCKDMRGVMVDGKCDYIDGVVDKTPANCPPGSSFKLDGSTGILRLVCVPCSLTKKFVRQSCEKKIPGVSWVSFCYYKSICAGTDTIFGLEFWEIGGTSGKGGDTGSQGNCYDKRDKCAGEP